MTRNLWWCWDPEASGLFEFEGHYDTWEELRHNPVAMLQALEGSDALTSALADPKWTARAEAVLARFDAYMAEAPRALGRGEQIVSPEHPVAYFCAEFGIHESLPLYSGGLGILAGDHLKSASDLRVPFVAVGIFYRAGYFRQSVNAKGEQIAHEHENALERLPIDAVCGPDGAQLQVSIPLADRELHLRAWQISVGHTRLLLLDADLPANTESDRAITRRLYGGAEEMRIQQELVLGCGGARLLRAMGLEPSSWHMNEGHAAFLSLERTSWLVADGWSFDDAQARVRANTLFTTHTPVPAGHDKFGEDQARPYLEHFAKGTGQSWQELMALANTDAEPDVFNMTILALSFASYTNGVSKLHGVASRSLFAEYWPEVGEDEIPIDTITNGIHLATWVHPKIATALGTPARSVKPSDYTNASNIDAADLWRRRHELKTVLIEQCRRTLTTSEAANDLGPMLEGLNDDVMLIGFARRFATYKRAALFISDPERLAEILDTPGRPVRILVAGKAHPRDKAGQTVMQQIIESSRHGVLRGKVFFLENYNIALGRALVQGVDVWLNNPQRMQEASGTSGMKAAANGGLNLSIADGWWSEAADGKNGWTIAPHDEIDDPVEQDRVDQADLYNLLAAEVIPRFFDRDDHGIPRAWMDMVIHNLQTIPPIFNTDRMVQEYLDRAYRPLACVDRDDEAHPVARHS